METLQSAPGGGPGIVSAGNPGDGIGDRPKMAEALASLKEGLSEKDDPFYDGWKLRKPSGVAPVLAENPPSVEQVDAAPIEQIDTVPVRVVPYTVFPKWAMVIVAALVVFAGIIAVVGVGARSAKAPGVLATPSGVAAEPSAAHVGSWPSAEPEPTFARSAEAIATLAASAAPPRKAKAAKEKKGKPQDTGFFRDPGF
jgi:hypothetical protein